MRARSLAALVVVPFLFPAACDDDGGASGEPFSIATYNIGLAHGYVSYAAQRRDEIGAVLAEIDADVICLQEVWLQEDIDAVANATSADYPYEHHVFLEDKTLGPPACGLTEASDLRACVDTNCADVSSGEISDCVLDKCLTEFFATSTKCQGCMATQLGNPIDHIFDFCTEASQLYSYNGASGIIMLSKHAFDETYHLKLDSSLTQRAVLGATLTLPGDLKADVYCTHIAADLSSSITYQGTHGTYESENRYQAQAILDFIATNDSGAKATFITGDFNSGPAIGDDIIAQLPDAAYKLLTDAGYVADFPTTADAACTFCAENTLVADTHDNDLIDHVFAKGISGRNVTSTRIGTTTLEIMDQNATVQTHPSDHFGVRAQID